MFETPTPCLSPSWLSCHHEAKQGSVTQSHLLCYHRTKVTELATMGWHLWNRKPEWAFFFLSSPFIMGISYRDRDPVHTLFNILYKAILNLNVCLVKGIQKTGHKWEAAWQENEPKRWKLGVSWHSGWAGTPGVEQLAGRPDWQRAFCPGGSRNENWISTVSQVMRVLESLAGKFRLDPIGNREWL